MHNSFKKFAQGVLAFVFLFTFLPVNAETALEPLQILDTHIADTSIAFDVKDVNLPSDELYFMECTEVGNELYVNNPRQILSQIPNNVSSHIQMMVGNLKNNTQYNCYVAVQKSSGQFVRHSEQKIITTKKSLEPNLIHLTSSPSANNFVLKAKTGDKITFTGNSDRSGAVRTSWEWDISDDSVLSCSGYSSLTVHCTVLKYGISSVEFSMRSVMADGTEYSDSETILVNGISTGSTLPSILEPLQILDTHIADTSIAFDVKDVNLPSDELYFMECTEVGNELYVNNPRQILSQIPNNVSSHIQMMVGNLKNNTQYNCYVAVKKSNGQYVRHSEQKIITTKGPQKSLRIHEIIATTEEDGTPGITAWAEEVELGTNESYNLLCSLKGNASPFQPSVNSSVSILRLANLKEDSEYNCQISVATRYSDGSVIYSRHSEQKLITTSRSNANTVEISKYTLNGNKIYFYTDYQLQSHEYYYATCYRGNNNDFSVITKSNPVILEVATGFKYVDCQMGVTYSPTGGSVDKNTRADFDIYVPVVEPSSVVLPPAGYEDKVITNPKSYKNPFPDTRLTNLEGISASELYRRGVIGGYPDGEFKGNREVNRAEAAKFLLLARFGTVSEIQNNGKFPDVKDGEWYVPFVVTAANKGIISGYPDGVFRPQNTVNTAEFLKMLSLTFGLSENLSYSYTDVRSTDWFAPYAGVAQKYTLFPGRTTRLNPSANLTRKEVAIAIYQYLKNRD